MVASSVALVRKNPVISKVGHLAIARTLELTKGFKVIGCLVFSVVGCIPSLAEFRITVALMSLLPQGRLYTLPSKGS